jgi:hypothetical protein
MGNWLTNKGAIQMKTIDLSIDQLTALGYDVGEDSDQPGKFLWSRGGDGSDISFDTMEGAIQDASKDALRRGPDEISLCANCEAAHWTDELDEIRDLSQRLAPGGTTPSGQCTHCGALAYPVRNDDPELIAYRVILTDGADTMHQVVFDCKAMDDTQASQKALKAFPAGDIQSILPSGVGHLNKSTIYSPSEGRANGGRGYWNNLLGWVEQDLAKQFTETEKLAMDSLPASRGRDARWVEVDYANEVLRLKTAIEQHLARLRTIAQDPVSIQYTDKIDIEVASEFGDRIIVGRAGWGSTVVNYTDEGLILDVYADGRLDSIHTASIGSDELAAETEEEHHAG